MPFLATSNHVQEEISRLTDWLRGISFCVFGLAKVCSGDIISGNRTKVLAEVSAYNHEYEPE